MLSPKDYMPAQPEDLLLVEPDDLALPLLRFLDALEKQHGAGRLLLHNLTLPDRGSQFASYAGPLHDRVLQHIGETWSVIERRGWLVEDTSRGWQQGWRRITSAGKRALDAAKREDWASTSMLPCDMDQQLADDVTAPFVRGRTSDAVRAALRRVEVRVREITQLQSPGRRGLMVDAFRLADSSRGLEQGPLRDPLRGDGPEGSLRMVFEGAMGAWLNEHTHSDLPIESAAEAAELIHLANLLLRIVERRRPT